jgi:hypothetical protein
METIKIIIPDGCEIDRKKSTFEEIVFKPIKKLPKKWEDLNSIIGYYTNMSSEIKRFNGDSKKGNENVFKTKEQAEAAIALAKLSQLIHTYNSGWTPNWNDNTRKYVMSFESNDINFNISINTQSFIAFKTEKLRNEFYDNFRELILEARPLL